MLIKPGTIRLTYRTCSMPSIGAAVHSRIRIELSRRGLFLRGCAPPPSRGVRGHRGPDQFLEGAFVELPAFANVDGPAQVPAETGVEQLVRVRQRGASEESQLHHLLVRLPRTDTAVMGPHRSPGRARLHPFPFFLDLRVGVMDELSNPGQRLAPPIPQRVDLLGDVLRSGRFVRCTFSRHGLSYPIFDPGPAGCDSCLMQDEPERGL